MSIVFQNKDKVEEKEFMSDHGQLVNELIAVKSKIKEIEEKYIEPLRGLMA